MKNMAKMHLLAAPLIALAMVACGGGHNSAAPDTVETAQEWWSGVEESNANSFVKIYGIQDREGEQAVDLFRGSYDDALLGALVDSGQTAFASAFNVYLVQGNSGNGDSLTHTILFDAGIGPQAGGKLLERMHEKGVESAAVEAVCLTHLHFDHLGWLLDEEGNVTFTNADLYLSDKELASARADERWQQVMAAYGERVKTFSDGDTICYGLVRTMVLPGHTPGHTVYVVGPCLIVGDLLHAQDLQLEHPDFCARYDADPAAAVEVRKRIYDLARRSGRYLCGAHCYERFIEL